MRGGRFVAGPIKALSLPESAAKMALGRQDTATVTAVHAQ